MCSVHTTEYMLCKAENALSSNNKKNSCTVLEVVDFNDAF